MSRWSKPSSELNPVYINLPDGKYEGAVSGFELVSNDAGTYTWFTGQFNDVVTQAGETQVTTPTGTTIDLTNRRPSFRFTVEGASEIAVKIGEGAVIKLAQALGVTEEDSEGNVYIPDVETAEDVVALLRPYEGTRVNFSIRNRPRTQKNAAGEREPVLNEAGEPIINEEVGAIWAVSETARV